MEKIMCKVDAKTGRKYINNIPENSITAITTSDGTHYQIIAQNHDHMEECWYHDNFMGDHYAVFKTENGIRQQVSMWYFRYGNAVRKMFKLVK